jgi:hypothetical protein
MKEISDFSAKSLFKLLLACNIGFFAPLSLVLALLSLFGVVPMNFNDVEHYGFSGFIIHLLFMPFYVLMFTVLYWLVFSIGLKIYQGTYKLVKGSR